MTYLILLRQFKQTIQPILSNIIPVIYVDVLVGGNYNTSQSYVWMFPD